MIIETFPFDAMKIPFEPLFCVIQDTPISGIFMLIKESEFLVFQKSHFLNTHCTQDAQIQTSGPWILIGKYAHNQPVYIAQLTHYYGDQYHLQHSRDIFPLCNDAQVMVMMRGIQLLHFIKDHAFCGRCGTQNIMKTEEPCMRCPSCHHLQYPIVSPAILALIEHENKILLAHNMRFPDGLYSLVAGFCESGEMAEDTVVREVFEEVGIIIKNVQFMASQSWPYPHSLMLGFRAQWERGQIVCDGIEIVDAQWFGIKDLPTLPNGDSLARKMINIWAQEQGVSLGKEKNLDQHDKL
ncbi:MAG: NAD(+) diphosphatase [Spirochaetia bacterium]